MRKSLLELPVILLVSFGFVRPVVASPFYVGSESMAPTQLAYDLEEPHRGDIVLFESPDGGVKHQSRSNRARPKR